VAAPPAVGQTVVDGDTLKLCGTTFRIWGIDAAETKQACAEGWMAGNEASKAMRELVKGRAVTCEEKTSDRYGRTVALCRAGGEDLGAAMVERLYAVRLDRLRELEDCRALLAPRDRQGLLADAKPAAAVASELDDDELLSQLGVDANADPDITNLQHVRSAADKRAAEEIANRQKCEDFDRFRSLFKQVQEELETGSRQTRPFELKAEIRPGRWFIVGGQKAYVDSVGETFTNPQGRTDARLRVIFDNGTESNMLMRSLQRALNKDDAGRRIADPDAGPLFSGEAVEDDQTWLPSQRTNS
jgi:hypothetical protein